jgi:hypothetical protein
MAIITSSLFDDISGTCGGVVFRRKFGKITMSARPLKGTQKKATKAIEAWRRQYSGVLSKAKKLYADPVKRAEYAAKCPTNQSVWNFFLSELANEARKKKGPTQGNGKR